MLIGRQAETVVGLPWAADSCPWVGKLRTVLPLSVGIRDSAVQLVLTHQASGVHESVDLVVSGFHRTTAMKKLRIVILGFGTARQKIVLESWTNSKPLQNIWDRAAI
jgi:hypothetical protein